MKTKTLFAAVMALAIGMVSCSNEPTSKIPVYGWQGEGENVTAESIQSDFQKWKAHGLDGMCYNAGGFNAERNMRVPLRLLTRMAWSIMRGFPVC